MMAIVRALRRRMVVKVFLAVALVVTGALLAFAWRQTTAEIAQLRKASRDSAEQLARVLVGSIETTMLQGDGILVKNQVKRLKRDLPGAEIRIYDPRGLEVFGDLPLAPDRSSLPRPLAATLGDAQPRRDAGREWRPIANEERCHECHPAEPRLRGVLEVKPPVSPPSRQEVIGALVESAFIQIMTAEKQDELDSYFKELVTRAPGIAHVGIYNSDGGIAYGAEVAGVTQEALAVTLRAGATRVRTASGAGDLQLIPLAMEERCEQCHERDVPVRGVLAIVLGELSSGSAEAERSAVIDTSLRYIMLSSLGRMIGGFLDAVAASGAAAEIALYDADGRTYYTSVPAPPAPHIAAALDSRAPSASYVGSDEHERVRVVEPLVNDAKCARCHGADRPVRGVVTVAVSTRAAMEARELAKRRAVLFIAIALVVVLVVVYTLLQLLVVSPVKRIGAVADAVGQGRLDVSVSEVAPNGDEMQRLGARMNDMIHGLRTASHLRRFVSRGAAEAAHGAAQVASVSGRFAATAGERCTATIVFTDLRGFTAYSETVPPETVVDMLNRFLQVQADVVAIHGGDIDKYVGDEVMAVFRGDDAVERAVRAAIEMVDAVERVRGPGETLAVGCGISTGEVIHGPIGSAERMDFTVIGDVVNTGARLCSAAKGGEVIVTAAVREACGVLEDIELVALEPLQVKGKRQPLPVFRAVRRAGANEAPVA